MKLKSLRDVLQIDILSPPVPLHTNPENMGRIYGITHSGALNNRHLNKILAPMQAILPERDTGVSVQGDGSRRKWLPSLTMPSRTTTYLTTSMRRATVDRDRDDNFDDYKACFHERRSMVWPER